MELLPETLENIIDLILAITRNQVCDIFIKWYMDKGLRM